MKIQTIPVKTYAMEVERMLGRVEIRQIDLGQFSEYIHCLHLE